MAPQRGHEPLEIRPVVVDLRGEPQMAAAAGNEDTVAREPLDQIGGRPLGEPNAQEMRAAQPLGQGREAERSKVRGELAVEFGEGGGDARHAPVQDPLQGDPGHRQEREVRALAHIETARPGRPRFRVVDEAGEVLRPPPRDPALLERSALSMFGGDPETARRSGTEAPFVGRGGGEGGSDAAQLERHGPGRPGEVEHERDPELSAAPTDRLEIEDPAVGPADLRQGRDRHPLVERFENGGGQIAVGTNLDRYDLAALLGHQPPPGIEVRRELSGQDRDLATGSGAQIEGGYRDAVARRRNDRDTLGIGTQDTGGEPAHAFRLLEEVGWADGPGSSLAGDPDFPRADGLAQQRCHRGGVAIGHLARQVEQVALARKGLDRGRGSERSARHPGAARAVGERPGPRGGPVAGEHPWTRRSLCSISAAC